jgi:drug/metabolite transporter (DMT)-like permease
VIVPVLIALTERRWPDRRTTSGVVLAVVGLYLLSGSEAGGTGWGELLTLACAVAFAVHLVLVGKGAPTFDPVRFTFVQVLTVGVVCTVPGPWLGGFDFSRSTWVAVVFTGVFATAVAFGCMVVGQRTVPESRAALVLLVEPVSAGILGVATGEQLGLRGLIGALVILAAIVWVELVPLLTGEQEDDPAIEPTVHG